MSTVRVVITTYVIGFAMRMELTHAKRLEQHLEHSQCSVLLSLSY